MLNRLPYLKIKIIERNKKVIQVNLDIPNFPKIGCISRAKLAVIEVPKIIFSELVDERDKTKFPKINPERNKVEIRIIKLIK